MAGIVPAAEGDHPGMTADNDLVVRTWRATATSAGAREYHSYFAGTLLPQLRDLPGFAGGYLLSRDVNGTVELTTHTFWESPAAVRAFAGDDVTASVVEPEAQSVLLDFDPTATHRSVLVDARG
jgi:heme-degrading monooxygenase HmoA